MSCICGVDVHAHVVPSDFPANVGNTIPKGWPLMAHADSCHKHVVIDGKNYRTVSDKCWSTSRRLSDFEGTGLALKAVSPMPELLRYWLSPNDGARLARYLNVEIAAIAAESGGRIVRLGVVPPGKTWIWRYVNCTT